MPQGTALITGASMGIGRELALQFAEHRHPLVVVARSGDKLRQLADEVVPRYGIPVEVIEIDLCSVGAARALYDEVSRRELRVDILVNNAGFGANGSFLGLDLRGQTEMIQLNVTVLTELCHLFGKAMAERGQGRILNVASTAAFQPGPWMAIYYASKSFVLSLSEALHEELRGAGISVTALCPGPVATGFQERANLGGSPLKRLSHMEAREVARQGYQATMAGRTLVIPGRLNQVLAFGNRFLPRAMITRVSGMLARKRDS